MSTAIPRNLEALTFAQLTTLERQVATLKNRRYDEAVQTAKTKAHDVIRRISTELGIREQDAPKVVVHGAVVRSANGRGRRRAKVAVRFRDPDNAENTWTGRGRAPRWLTAAEKGGHNRNEFRVQA